MFLVIVNAHTKCAEVILIISQTTYAIINVPSATFARFAWPEQLVSDNGPQFISEELNTFINANHIKHICSAPYHSPTNGLAERMVQRFKNAMKAA
ncbi:Pol polyprotein [Elysia marginata]|uniref:Pol polyprotein n=1 Tax=Elysia marginata TaxID=1093978 RepID=A0AAV4J9K5_9GAST|nr:Pol polyprotein [Elysia marginata]